MNTFFSDAIAFLIISSTHFDKVPSIDILKDHTEAKSNFVYVIL